MEPTDGFWNGVGTGIADADGWMLVIAITVITVTIGVVWLWARHIRPSKERVEMRELDIREHEARNDEERIKANAALAEQMSALRSSNEQIAQRFAETHAGIEESKVRSREMGGKIDRIDSATEHTDALVSELHKHLLMKGRKQ